MRDTAGSLVMASVASALAGCGDGFRLLDIAPSTGMEVAGATVPLTLQVSGPLGGRGSLPVTLEIWRGTERVGTVRRKIMVPASQSATRTVTLHWTAPSAPAVAGYGIEATIPGSGSTVSTAVDIGPSWTAKPRYGFLSDFSPLDTGEQDRFAVMARYHLNVLQFYDWMPSDALYVPTGPLYGDPLGRETATAVVRDKVDLSAAAHMAPMAYAAVYGAPVAFYNQHPTWALFDSSGKPEELGTNFLVLMDPSEGTPWTAYIQGQYRDLMAALPFWGIHLDQYGYPQTAYTAGPDPRTVDVGATFGPFIQTTADTVRSVRPDGYVDFNNVSNWPTDLTAPVPGNAVVYIEVWPPNVRFQDLQTLITAGRSLGNGKAVVLAAYIPPSNGPSVLLTDAVIFASGGYHLELGEGDGMLTGPYFPDYAAMPVPLTTSLRRYYDLAVRYQDLLFAGDLVDGPTPQIHGAPQSTGEAGGVWAWSRVAPDRKLCVVHLINLTGLADDQWATVRQTGPTTLSNVEVEVALPTTGALWIDPDGYDLRPQSVAVTKTAGGVTVTVPHLANWGTLVLTL